MRDYVQELHRIRHNAKYSEFGLWEQEKALEKDLNAEHAVTFAVHRALSQLLGRPSPPLLTMSTAVGVGVGASWVASKWFGGLAFGPSLMAIGYVAYCGDFHKLSQFQVIQRNRNAWHQLFEQGNELRGDLLREYRNGIAFMSPPSLQPPLTVSPAAPVVSREFKLGLAEWKRQYDVVHSFGNIPNKYYKRACDELNKEWEQDDIRRDQRDFDINL